MALDPAQQADPGELTQAGQFVAEARTRLGISQRELARRSGVPGPVVNAIERSRRQPSIPTLAKIMRGMGLELRLDAVPADGNPPAGVVTSTRLISEAEHARAHEIYDALMLANSIHRSKLREAARGVR